MRQQLFWIQLRTVIVIAFTVLMPGFTSAAEPMKGKEAQLREMKKLDWMTGNWKGSGWFQVGPQRKEFTQTEVIQRKLDGLVMLIEGQGTAKADGSPVHNALALVSYDTEAKRFRWRAFTAEGRQNDAEATVGTNRLEWTMQISERGRIRYKVERTARGEWFEVGEMTEDGSKWRKFFEMTLRRQNAAATDAH